MMACARMGEACWPIEWLSMDSWPLPFSVRRGLAALNVVPASLLPYFMRRSLRWAADCSWQ